MADFGDDLDAFRAEARAWLEANYPAELRGPKNADRSGGAWGGRAFAGSDDPQIVWMRRMAASGLDRPDLAEGLRRRRPHAPTRRGCWTQEMAAGGYRPPLASFGIWMLGPVLLEYGNEAQKREHLPKIIHGEIRWCQGYSEPGAGSDLASPADPLRGQGRPLADQRPEDLDLLRQQGRLVLLPGAHRHRRKKHEGISFLLIDMAQPGRRDPADQADQRRVARSARPSSPT